MRFIRLLARTCLGASIGPEACWLLTVIASTEDSKRYSGPVTYFNPNLADQMGVSVSSLDRARKKAVAAGWLHYEPGLKRQAGLYWVTIPEDEASKPDGPSCEDGGDFLRQVDEASDEASGRHSTKQAEGKRKAFDDPSYPSPNPKDKDSVPSSPTKARKPKTKSEPEPVLPFTSPAFREAWTAWVRHRKEIRKPLTPTASERQLKKLADMGEARAIAALDHSMANGWQGIFEPYASKPTPNQAPTPKYRPAGQQLRDDA
jgi:hypothetical protein